ncbi:MAG: hypothetical protein IJU23_01890 [Proteobacteria bacterium]|nr:hypothetical protein [Pseudomonadota bacterium]
MTKYELAGDKRITIAAVILEVLMLISCALLTDAIIEYVFKVQLLFTEPVSIEHTSIAVLVLQYLIVTIELIARHRDDQRGLTIPIVFLPGGIIVRTVTMIILELLVITFKLLAYFISVLLSFVFQIFHVDKFLNTAALVDVTDRYLEPLEILVNKVYNLLYFHKIRANTSVFTSVFNGSLSFWCINH